MSHALQHCQPVWHLCAGLGQRLSNLVSGCALLASLLLGLGCNNQSTPASIAPVAASGTAAGIPAQTPNTAAASTTGATGGATGDSLPPAPDATGSVSLDDEPDEDPELMEVTQEDAKLSELEKGSPEWLMREILQVKLRPLPKLERKVAEGAAAETAPNEAELAEQLEAQKKARREKNEAVIELAMEAIAKTAKDEPREILFNAAVHHMLEARLQLALTGEAASVDALYEAAELFYDRKPDSPTAAEAQLVLVQLAHASATRGGEAGARWLQEFARQSQVYATKFPAEQQRAIPLLLAAARSNEAAGQLEFAKSCYGTLQARYPEHPQVQQVAGVLRRLQLVGQPLQFGGPTMDGHHLTIEEYLGKTAVIVFWASTAKPFTDHAAPLAALSKRYEKYASFIGVNLDTDERAVEKLLETSGIAWPQVFHTEPAQRGWAAPLAVYYGINTLPTIWIVDPQGIVAVNDATPETLEEQMRVVIQKHRQGAATTSAAAPAPAAN